MAEEQLVHFTDVKMWTCHQLKDWLVAQGHPDVWDAQVYPGMKRIVEFAFVSAQVCCTFDGARL